MVKKIYRKAIIKENNKTRANSFFDATEGFSKQSEEFFNKVQEEMLNGDDDEFFQENWNIDGAPQNEVKVTKTVTVIHETNTNIDTSSEQFNTVIPKNSYGQESANNINLDWPKKSKKVAAVLGIFFGGIGAHKFYLGKPWLGILYLLFFATGIPVIIGLIEGLSYLCYSDRDFEVKYKVRLT
ncbi:TM2 domain-containing protein [Anaeromicropila herbilytica]|uniref:TM2 domain-containing protein n=1 Tax=Anaeromicropila herbilytica TaxID=2785025 RepID=A0A7R7EPE8_9FIRM|nr:TM2 domain-containing protein [Anaeromicropila herbilytica]BCN32489.1 hypothetical protein bsdtb5_37840 [Anaeromicropila herbilytica]